MARPYNFFAAYCFVHSNVFERVGGFSLGHGVNEDHWFGRRTAALGKVAYVRDEYIVFSARRYEAVGYCRYWTRTRLTGHREYPILGSDGERK